MDRFEMSTYYEELCSRCDDGACCGDCDEDLNEDLNEDLIIVKKIETNKSLLSEFCKKQAEKYDISESIVIDALNNGEEIEDWISYINTHPYYNEVTS